MRKLREYMENLRNKLFKTGFFHIFGSSVINKIVTFASGIILVRILSKEEYGVYTYAENLLSFFTLITGFGVSSGILQLCSETNDNDLRVKIYQYGCRFGLIFNSVIAAIILAIALLIPLPINGANGCLALMCALPLVQLFSELQRTFLRTELKNKEYGYANTFNTFVTFVSACLLSYLFRSSGLVLAHYLAAFSTALIIVVIYNVPFSIRRSILDEATIKSLLNISSISMVNNGLSKLMYLLDIFVLGLVVPDETVIASYKIATTIPNALIFVPASVIIYVYPYFARNKDNKKWLKKNYLRVTLAMGSFNLLISTMLVIFAPLIIKIVFGEQYLDALIPFRILSVSYLFSGTFRILAGNILITQRKLKYNLFVAVFSSGLNTLLNVLLINRWESMGAALATIITVIVTSILNVGYLKKTFDNIK